MADARGSHSRAAGGAHAPLGSIVEVSSRRFAIPFQCPCCGAAPDSSLIVPVTPAKERSVSPTSARGLEFPYCRRCVLHVASWQGAGVVSTGITLGGIILGAIIGLAAHALAGLIVIAAAIGIAYGLVTHRRSQAAAACGPACPSPDAAVAYYGWSGNTSSFAFRSPTYTARFAEDNTSKLVNMSPQLRRLVDGHRVARLAVPTPAAAMIVPAPRTAREWIAKIESAQSQFSRRTDLQNALELVADPAEKQELIRAATSIELAPIRERVERMTGTPRVRYLDARIAEIHADNVPVELQHAVIAELEALRTS
jgi:hypothetical protein